MITNIEIAASNEVAVGLKTGSVAETIEETGSFASETASMFQRIAGILDTIYHNPTKRTVPAIMQDYAKRGEVLQIKTLTVRKRSYTLGLLTITEEDQHER